MRERVSRPTCGLPDPCCIVLWCATNLARPERGYTPICCAKVHVRYVQSMSPDDVGALAFNAEGLTWRQMLLPQLGRQGVKFWHVVGWCVWEITPRHSLQQIGGSRSWLSSFMITGVSCSFHSMHLTNLAVDRSGSFSDVSPPQWVHVLSSMC